MTEIDEAYRKWAEGLSEKIIANNGEIFQKTLEIIRDLYNNSFIGEVLSVETVDEKIILKLSDELIADMGGYERFNAKIVMVKEIALSLPENSVGKIDAQNPDKVYYDKTPLHEEPEEAEEEAAAAEGEQSESAESDPQNGGSQTENGESAG